MFPSRQAFAINLSDSSLEAIELVRDTDGFSIKAYSRLMLESGVIEDGKIVAPDKLKIAVKKLLQQAKPSPITAREVVITIPESKVFVQGFTLPTSAHAKHVPASLFAQARQTIPIDASLMAADYLVAQRRGAVTEYVFAATYKALLQQYTSFFQNMQLKVTFVTMESVALAAAVIDYAKDETVLLLDIGARTTIGSLVRGAYLQETINVNIAGNNITAALAEKLKVSANEAEQKKVSLGMAPRKDDGAELLIIQGQLQPLKDELVLFIKYYEEKSQDTVDRVLLAGGSASMAGLAEYFEANIGLPTKLASPLPIYHGALEQSSLPTFLVVLGLARLALDPADDRTINFLSKSERDWEMKKKTDIEQLNSQPADAVALASPKRKIRRDVLLLAVLGAAVLLFSGVFFWKKYLSSRGSASTQGVVQSLRQNLQFVIQPFMKNDGDYGKTVTYRFSVAIGEAPVGDTIWKGRIETETLTEVVQYDAATLDLVKRSLEHDLGEGAGSDEAKVAEALGNWLADTVWERTLPSLTDRFIESNNSIIPWYVEKTITASEDQGTGESGIMSKSMTVKFSILVLDGADGFSAIEKQYTDFFIKANPEYDIRKRTFIFEQPPETQRVDVTGYYEYEKK